MRALDHSSKGGTSKYFMVYLVIKLGCFGYFDQPLGDAHSKRGLKSAFSKLFVLKELTEDIQARKLMQNEPKTCVLSFPPNAGQGINLGIK